MLFPYLSDPSINISIIPFIVTKKDSSQLSPKNITPLFIKYLIFIYYIFILIVIIALDSTVTLDEPETMDVLICAGILAKLKGKWKASGTVPSKPESMPATSDSWEDITASEVVEKEHSRLDGTYPNLSSLPNQGVRTPTVTEIDYSGSVIDIRAGSEWDIRSETSASTNSVYNYCSTCPQVSAGSLLDRDGVSLTTKSMIESIANEETSSINLDNLSIISSSGNSIASVSESAATESTVLSLGKFESRIVTDIYGNWTAPSSTSLPDLDSQTSPSSNLESPVDSEINRVRAITELIKSPSVRETSDTEFSQFSAGFCMIQQTIKLVFWLIDT
jgi:hypothetical protein